ncbi:MAG: dienelactone hydrolase family protein [Chloroflexi bacterium]|nr:dienelactone hydrolase family protein [Chloroflexota bacterium]
MYRTDMYEGMLAETVTVTGHNGDAIGAYFARPLGEGPFPGVVLIHHLPGWDEFYRETTRRFAHHGYAAISPNLYHREGHGTPEDVAAMVRADGGVPDEQVVGDVVASARFLRGLPTANSKVGVIGTCSGGRHTVLVASRSTEFDAAVDCWGGRVVMPEDELTEKLPVAPIDYTADLAAPLLGLFGADDQSPSPEQVAQHEQALQEHGKEYEFHMYEGAGHGFFYWNRPAYRIDQAMDGWDKVWDFFGRHLSS